MVFRMIQKGSGFLNFRRKSLVWKWQWIHDVTFWKLDSPFSDFLAEVVSSKETHQSLASNSSSRKKPWILWRDSETLNYYITFCKALWRLYGAIATWSNQCKQSESIFAFDRGNIMASATWSQHVAWSECILRAIRSWTKHVVDVWMGRSQFEIWHNRPASNKKHSIS